MGVDGTPGIGYRGAVHEVPRSVAEIPIAMLFSDIEGSTLAARALGSEWPRVLGEHHDILRSAIAEAGGRVELTEGDAFFATFRDGSDAVAAAAAAQRALRGHRWPAMVQELRVRIGVHVGLVERVETGLVGIEIHRAARIAAAAHGGQVLVSAETRAGLDDSAEVEDLGLHRLKDFPEPMRLFHLRVDRDRGAGAFPSPRSLQVRPTNLPPARRALVGRDAVVSEARAGLREHRLVTLTGLGGVGKTHLALAVALAELERHPGGVWLVHGERVTAAGELIPSAAAAMRVRDVPDVRLVDAIADHLQADAALVVFDNLEHLPGAAMEVVELLSAAHSLRILATSRAPLRVAIEHRIAVQPLGAEDAAQLFAVLAREADPDAELDDWLAIDAVCRAVEGLPLALELTAARLRVVSVTQLAQRLGSLADVRSASPDLPVRQQSLRATIEWSLALLSSPAQKLFSWMGVFAGPVAVEVIEAVCEDEIDVLEAASELLDYALLRRHPTGLELVAALREVASERLALSGDEKRVRQAHARVIIATAAAAGRVTSAGRADRLRVVALFDEAWRAAAWSREADPRLHMRLATLYATPWGFFQGRVREALNESTLAVSTAETIATPTELAEALLTHSQTLSWAGEAGESLRATQRAAELIADPSPEQATHLAHVTSLAHIGVRDYPAAVQAAGEAVLHARSIGHQGTLLASLAYHAQALVCVGEFDAAGPLLDEAETLARQTDTTVAMWLPTFRADWSLVQGDAHGALAGYTAAMTSALVEGEVGSAIWSAAGIVVALSALHGPAAAFEAGILLELAAAEQGIALALVRESGMTVSQAIDDALGRLPAREAQAIRDRASAAPKNQRLEYILSIAAVASAGTGSPLSADGDHAGPGSGGSA